MKIKKGILSYSEKFERIVLTAKTTNSRPISKCGACGQRVKWLTLFEVSAITGKTSEELTNLIADGDFHFLINEERQFFLCAESVLNDL